MTRASVARRRQSVNPILSETWSNTNFGESTLLTTTSPDHSLVFDFQNLNFYIFFFFVNMGPYLGFAILTLLDCVRREHESKLVRRPPVLVAIISEPNARISFQF